MLCESGRSYDLKHGYHCQPNQQDHLHVYLGNDKLCAINRDGTPSHNTTIDLPRKVRQRIAALGLVRIEEETDLLLESTVQKIDSNLMSVLVSTSSRLRVDPSFENR